MNSRLWNKRVKIAKTQRRGDPIRQEHGLFQTAKIGFSGLLIHVFAKHSVLTISTNPLK